MQQRNVSTGGNAGAPAAVIFSATCASTDQVGMCVRVAGPQVGDVLQVTRADIFSPAQMPAVGIITAKADATHCTVVRTGEVPGTSLLVGRKYFVGTDGYPSLMPMDGPGQTYCVQCIGVAVTANLLLFDAWPISAIRVPP